MASISGDPPRFPRGRERISISIPAGVLQSLVARSNHEGRSISNLCAFLLERAMEHYELP